MGSSSWLTAVKRAFRSPSKDSHKKSSTPNVTRNHQQEHGDDDDLHQHKRTERRRWLFRKYSSNAAEIGDNKTNTSVSRSDHEHALAVAAATAKAAEAAAATAKAAVEIIRLAQPASSNAAAAAALFKHHRAAKLIQTAFRGYLARRALIALKGIVKLQALIRGQNVRRQANMTMKCMQALLRVQARVRDQRARLSHDGGRRNSTLGETNSSWESRYLKDIRDRRSLSRDGSYAADEWKDCSITHENSLAFAFSQQAIQDSDRNLCLDGENHVENRANHLEKWAAAKQWEPTCRASADYRRDSIKTVEVDSLKTSSTGRKSYSPSPSRKQSIPQAEASPHRRSSSLVYNARTPLARSSSPQRMKEEKSYSTANTPSLRSISRLTSSVPRSSSSTSVNDGSCNGAVPSYMASTESAKARIRSQSAPRQRASTPERDRSGGSAKKRLAYPVPEPYYMNYGFSCSSFEQNMKSPSFKSVQAGCVGMELQSNQSCYTDSIGGEISPCSTTDLRRWLR